ncbi:MAG: DUF1573 domain-containing protein [Candidatus Omnitrophica bacterium]|nr:DUF1573 domain-containing protein [Candidatus Omnitrophota bacterium]
MRKFAFLIFLIGLTFIQIACVVQSKQLIPVVRQVEESDMVDFGTIKEGTVLAHSFVLKNNFSKTLTVRDVSTSCGCTVSRVKNKIIPPGASTTVEASFNSRGESGPVEQHIYVYTDSLDSPVIRFIIKANVIK